MATKRLLHDALFAAAIANAVLTSRVFAEQRNFTIPVQEKVVDIGSGLKYDAWTYGGTYRVRSCGCDKATTSIFIW